MTYNDADRKVAPLKLIMALIVLVAVLGALYNIPPNIVNMITQWLVSIFISTTFSIVAGSFVEAVTGDTLKQIFLTIPIKGDFSISISVFVIATFIVKIWLFGGV